MQGAVVHGLIKAHLVSLELGPRRDGASVYPIHAVGFAAERRLADRLAWCLPIALVSLRLPAVPAAPEAILPTCRGAIRGSGMGTSS